MPKTKPSRGGAREGAGRPMDYDERMVQYPVSLADTHLTMIEDWADDFALTDRAAQRPAVIREMLKVADEWRRGKRSKRRR